MAIALKQISSEPLHELNTTPLIDILLVLLVLVIGLISYSRLAVREYPQTPAVEEALYIMAASYDKLGLEQLRVDAERVLTKNFPNTQNETAASNE